MSEGNGRATLEVRDLRAEVEGRTREGGGSSWASVVLVGNTSRPPTDLVRTAHLFADLPPAMIDPAFLDRLHYYLPGWETPKLETRLFTSHFGFVSDYFAEALRQVRKRSQVRAVDEDFALGAHLSARDEKAVRKTVSGLLKILHPDGGWTRAELREYLEFALEGRRRVKEQLKKLAPHDYAKTAFSYVERETGHEYWIEVPEQPEDLESVLGAASAASSPDSAPAEARTVDLIKSSESKWVEFKQTGRLNLHTKQKDPVIELMVLKAVAGFMNAEGGTLLIGVTDAGDVFGVESDYKTLGSKQSQDGFALWLNGLLDNALGPTAASMVSIRFEEIADGTVCRVDVRPAGAPMFLRRGKDGADLYVRLNNASRLLNTSEALEYSKSHWG